MFTAKRILLFLCLFLFQQSAAKPTDEAEIERLVNKVLKDSGKSSALKTEEIARVKSLVMLKLKLDKNTVLHEDTAEETRKKSNALNDLLSTSPEDTKAIKGQVDTYNKVIVAENTHYADINSSKNHKNSTAYEASLVPESSIRKKEMRHVVVKSGDTLTGIANSVYGTILKYKIIYEANDDILRNPNKISIGQRLRVPE